MILVITYTFVRVSVDIIKELSAKPRQGAMLLDAESQWALGLSVPLLSLESWQLTQIPGIGGGLAAGLEHLIARLSHHPHNDPISTLKSVHGIGEGKAKSLCGYFYAHGCSLPSPIAKIVDATKGKKTRDHLISERRATPLPHRIKSSPKKNSTDSVNIHHAKRLRKTTIRHRGNFSSSLQIKSK